MLLPRTSPTLAAAREDCVFRENWQNWKEGLWTCLRVYKKASLPCLHSLSSPPLTHNLCLFSSSFFHFIHHIPSSTPLSCSTHHANALCKVSPRRPLSFPRCRLRQHWSRFTCHGGKSLSTPQYITAHHLILCNRCQSHHIFHTSSPCHRFSEGSYRGLRTCRRLPSHSHRGERTEKVTRT